MASCLLLTQREVKPLGPLEKETLPGTKQSAANPASRAERVLNSASSKETNNSRASILEVLSEVFTGEKSSIPRRFQRVIPLLCLILTSSLLFLFRFLTLTIYAYPPSGDAGGDLYQAHAWLGHAIPGLSSSPLTGPVYSFLIVIPFTTLLPVLEGIQAYMAFVPAILCFPAYYWIRQSGANPFWALTGAALLGGAAAFSLMVTWNAAYNLFGIFMLTWFVGFLTAYLRRPRRATLILTGMSFAGIAASHPLTFLVAVLLLGLISIERTTVSFGRWGNLKEVGWIWTSCAGFGALVSPLYASLLPLTTTSGQGPQTLSSALTQIQSNLPAAVFLPWGFQSVTYQMMAIVPISVSFLAFMYLGRESVPTPFVESVTFLFVAAMIVACLDPSNFYRGLYFLPLPFVCAIPVFLQAIARQIRTLDRAQSNRPSLRGQSRFNSGRTSRTASSVLTISISVVLAASLLWMSFGFSQEEFVDGIQFNLTLTPQKVAAMNWIRDSTPENASFYDAASLGPWMWGYAERMSYTPQPLYDLVTTQSLSWGRMTDAVAMGTYLLSDGNLIVSSSYPSPNDPLDFLLPVEGYWYPLLLSSGSNVGANISTTAGPHVFPVQYAALKDSMSQENPNGSVSYEFNLTWIGYDQSITQRMVLTGGTATISVTSANSTLIGMQYGFGMPPSSYYFNYVHVQSETNVSSLTDTLSFRGSYFQISLSGGLCSQLVLSDAWTSISCDVNSTLTFTVAGLPPVPGMTPSAVNTSNYVIELSVSYFIVDVNSSSSIYLRLRSHTMGGLNVIQVFQDGPILVYKV